MTLISYNGYWNLYKEIDGRHFLLYMDQRIGPSILEVKAEELENLPKRETKTVTMVGGTEYVEEIYSEEVIITFQRMPLKELEEWCQKTVE